MIIYSFIPILSIYAGWRIQKFWVLFGINLLISYGLSLPFQILFPFPYGMVMSIIAGIIVSVIVVRYFAIKYNEKIAAETL